MLSTEAAVWNGPGEPLSVERLALDEPAEREVLVRLVASGVCHSDLHVVTGEWERPTPVVLGHEGAGVVEAVGRGVGSLCLGDHVVLSWTPFCGSCRYCVSGRPVLCDAATTADGPINGRRTRLWRDGEPVHSGAGVGAFAQYTVVPESGAIRVRKDVPMDVAAIVGCAVTTGVGAVINTARVTPGATMMVIGCGGVGLSSVLGGRLAAAGQIIAVDRVQEKLRLAAQLGATATIDTAEQDLAGEIRRLTGGRGVDYAFEAIGNPRTIEHAYESLAAGGTAVVVGQVADGVTITIDPMTLSDREKTITGSNYGSARPPLDFPLLLDLYADGRLDLDPLIAKRLPLADINDAFESLKTGRAARSVIVHDPSLIRGNQARA